MTANVVPGALFEADWGRYRVHRVTPGAGPWEVVLVDTERPTAYIGSSIADLEAEVKYKFVGLAATRLAMATPPGAMPPPPAAGPTFFIAGLDAIGRARSAPTSRRTLGAVRPMGGMRGLLPGHATGGSLVTIPDVEEFYWLPCVKYADDPLYMPPEVIEGVEIHPVRRPIAIPHAMHITSSHHPRLRCDGCQPRPVAVDPAAHRLIRERSNPIAQRLDHPYAPGSELPAPGLAAASRTPPSTPPRARTEPAAPTLPLGPEPTRDVLAEDRGIAATPRDRELEEWIASVAEEHAREAAAAAPSSPAIPVSAPPTPTGTPKVDVEIEIKLVWPASSARAGLTGWYAQFGTEEGRLHSAAEDGPWAAIAWAIASWLRHLRGAPVNLARSKSLPTYPPLLLDGGTYDEHPALKEA